MLTQLAGADRVDGPMAAGIRLARDIPRSGACVQKVDRPGLPGIDLPSCADRAYGGGAPAHIQAHPWQAGWEPAMIHRV